MSSPDPTCLVNGLVTPFDASASATLTLSLASPAGARFWSVSCTSTDELDASATVNATISINQTNKTATVTLPSTLGAAYIFTSIVGINGLGLDANSVSNKAFTTTFKVNVKASNGARVLAAAEQLEQNTAAGWVAVVNPSLRAGVSVPFTVGGTGFVHFTSGTADANARAVNLASNGAGGDVTGLLPFINGGHIQGDINVTHASAGTFDATHQIAYCDSSTGTTQITFPTAGAFGGTIPTDWQLLVADTGGVAGTSAITVVPNGSSVWNPNTQAFTTSSFTLGSNGALALWQWDANKSHYVLLDSGGGVGFGSVGNGGSVVTTTYTLQPLDLNTLIAAGSITTGPLNPIKGAVYRLTQASGVFESLPAHFVGNGYVVDAPDDGNYDNSSTVTDLVAPGGVALRNTRGPYSWWWDGVKMRLAS